MATILSTVVEGKERKAETVDGLYLHEEYGEERHPDTYPEHLSTPISGVRYSRQAVCCCAVQESANSTPRLKLTDSYTYRLFIFKKKELGIAADRFLMSSFTS